MAVSLIPENYKVFRGQNNLLGIVKISKNSKEDIIIPSFYVKALTARSYNRIYFMCVPVNADEGEAILRTYNGKTQFNGPIFDIKFGSDCIYVKTVEPRSNSVSWALVNKDLEPVKYLGDFAFTYYNADKDNYIPLSGKETVEITKPNGVRYKLYKKTGETEEYIVYSAKKKEPVVELPPEFYDIKINCRRNSITLTPSDRKTDLEVAVINNITNYESLFTDLLQVLPEKDSKMVTVGRHEEKEDTFIYRKVPAAKAEAFSSLVRTVKSKDDGIGIIVTSKYLKEKQSGLSGIALINALNKELNSGFTLLAEDGPDGRKYYVKVMKVGSDLVTLVRFHKSVKVVCNISQLGKDKVVSDEELMYILKYCESKGSKTEVFKVQLDKTFSLGDKAIPDSFIPRNIANNKDIKGRIKEFDYGYKNGFILKAWFDGNESKKITLRLILFDDFIYVPKRKTSDKNIVYQSRTNDTFIKLI